MTESTHSHRWKGVMAMEFVCHTNKVLCLLSAVVVQVRVPCVMSPLDFNGFSKYSCRSTSPPARLAEFSAVFCHCNGLRTEVYRRLYRTFVRSSCGDNKLTEQISNKNKLDSICRVPSQCNLLYVLCHFFVLSPIFKRYTILPFST